MIIALTGATGFLGGHVLRRAREAGHEVRALVRKPQPPCEGVEWIAGSLGDAASLATLCEGTDAIIHVAGVVNGDAATFDRANRLGTVGMLAAATGKRFVHVSSLAAREPQLSNYGASKRAAEDAVVASALDWRIVRPPAIYGPGDTDNLQLFRLAKWGIVPLPPKGRMSVIHADDMARLVVALVESAEPHSFYEGDDGLPGGWSHADFARAIGSAVGRKVATIPLPRPLVRAGAALDGLLRRGNAKLTPDRAAYFCHPDWVIEPVRRPPADLWTPQIATAAGLAATAAWYREAGWL
ncbi:NAD(P)-dependent oxidoreductase [Sphingomonas sp. SUN039]|uniref:NAD-dependent epimerase/dehydratase family protein n=1 Tax=Sphingomonas sp. SUN039 TaxID=2937787 RepID=UPI002164A6B3|nr:NAD(P)H-binding protein [Sphingomonas sp. SUN039]UVO54428.1 NAD(P)H-binding protein [Sphingomonas sp. SUN039]